MDGKMDLDLATIDIVEAMNNPEKATAQIGAAMQDVGFVYLVNIPNLCTQKLLQASHWFFKLPLEQKMKIAKRVFCEENTNQYRGYFPVIPGGHSFKEVFEIGSVFDKGDYSEKTINGRPAMKEFLYERNTWPVTGSDYDSKFEEIMLHHYGVFQRLGKFIMELIARHVGIKLEFFHSMFEDPNLSTFRLIHYPSRLHDPHLPSEAKDGDTVITTGEHADSTMLTLLATFENQGLQVLYKNRWHDIPPRMDGLVMNIGALLADMLGGDFKATIHRVIDKGEDRYSAPFFYEPALYADISRQINGEPIESLKDKPHLHKYGPWMANRTSQFVEYKTTDFGVLE